MSRSRNIGVDLLRVLSVVAVVVGHAWPGVPGEEYLQIWRMPLFFFLAGYFFSPTRGALGELAVRSRTLGVPYLAWLVLLIGAVWAMRLTPWPFQEVTVRGALFGGGYTDMPFLAFWFISVMFFAALLLRVVLLLPWWVGVLVALGGLTLAQTPGSAMSYTLLGIGLAPACMGFMLAGYWFRRACSLPAVAALPGKAGIGLLAIGTGFAGVWMGAETMNMKWSGFGTFLISPLLATMMAAGMVWVFSTVVDSVLRHSSRAMRVVSELVRTGTFVVFGHPLILYLTAQALGIDSPVARIALALAVCWSLGVAVNRTPLSPLLTGLPRAGRESLRTPGSPRPAARRR